MRGALVLALAITALFPVSRSLASQDDGTDSQGPQGVVQDQLQQPTTPPVPPVTVGQRWQLFVSETFTPWFPMIGAVGAGGSQLTDTDPKYGLGTLAFAKRFGALTTDNLTQNFFSDFAMATVFHQDTRYRRRGPAHGFWNRTLYAVSRAVVARNDNGANVFNWSNFVGTAMSAGLSNVYYPRGSRTSGAIAINWGNSVAGAGFGNLLPEFLPDFKQWLKRHHL
jgi:hypothetical protein